MLSRTKTADNRSKNKKVCFVRHGYYPNDPRTRKQSTALVEAGYDVDIVCIKMAGQVLRERIDGLRILRIPITHRRTNMGRYVFEYGLSFLLFGIVLTYLHLRNHYRCIHVATMPDFLVFATLVPKLLGARILLDLHEPTPELWFTKYGHRMQTLLRLQVKIEQSAVKFADMAITVTDELRNRLVERGAQPEKIAIVRNVCDDDVFSCPTGARRNRGVDGFRIMTHGLIEERYGHEEMIRAVNSLRNRIPNLRLEILGSGEFESQLMQLVKDLNCSDMVHFLGYVPHDELMRRLKAADVGVIAMRRSPYSELIDTNKMYEYVALRRPVIVSRLQPVERMFDDSCVKFYEPGDFQDLARCIVELFEDPSRGRELVENAYKRYAKVRWRHSKKEYVKVVDDLVAGRDGGRASLNCKARAGVSRVCESVISD